MKVGMAAEVTCVSKPFTIIPMVVTGVQDYIAAGQFRGGEQLIDAQQVGRQPIPFLFFCDKCFHEGSVSRAIWRKSSCISSRENLPKRRRRL